MIGSVVSLGDQWLENKKTYDTSLKDNFYSAKKQPIKGGVLQKKLSYASKHTDKTKAFVYIRHRECTESPLANLSSSCYISKISYSW